MDLVEFDPDEGFEAFTVAIHNEITRKGRDAFYVFDCLSELQSVWYTDLMMGNFFRVTCPYLFELDTVAYFPILRGRHSFDAIARIRETTQLLLDVYSNEKWIYLHPLKVWERNSETMFMPHGYRRSTGEFQLIDNGVSITDDPGNSCKKSGSEHRQLRSLFQHGQGCFSGEDVYTRYGDADY